MLFVAFLASKCFIGNRISKISVQLSNVRMKRDLEFEVTIVEMFAAVAPVLDERGRGGAWVKM